MKLERIDYSVYVIFFLIAFSCAYLAWQDVRTYRECRQMGFVSGGIYASTGTDWYGRWCAVERIANPSASPIQPFEDARQQHEQKERPTSIGEAR